MRRQPGRRWDDRRPDSHGRADAGLTAQAVEARVTSGYAADLGIQPGQLNVRCSRARTAWTCSADDTTQTDSGGVHQLHVTCPHNVCVWHESQPQAALSSIWTYCGDYQNWTKNRYSLYVIGLDCASIRASGPQALPRTDVGWQCRMRLYQTCFDGATFLTSRHAWDIDIVGGPSIGAPHAPGMYDCGPLQTSDPGRTPVLINGGRYLFETSGVPCAAAAELLIELNDAGSSPRGWRCSNLICFSSADRTKTFDAYPSGS